LNKTQSDISNKFAQTGIDKFEGMNCTNGLNDIPILPDFSVCLQCTTKHLYDGGDHVIIVGEVKSIENKNQEPLIFYKGDYLTI
jgi:3-hydroxy-9,10-secoandrosta-1,3,5(10)-triene-9,17-dione monooxygenase reductase component